MTKKTSARAATKIDEQCVYTCGPYKGYSGKAKYDSEDKSFHGEVMGTRDMITFAGDTIDELPKAFRDSVDDYLDFCKSLGKSPEKPFSGKFLARVKPETHRKISIMADLAGKSLNQLISECLDSIADASSASSLFAIPGMPGEIPLHKSTAAGKKKGVTSAAGSAKAAARSPSKPKQSRRELA